jgi:hypothetical protein
VRQFGTTSLLVYWVHIELVYGRWFGAEKETLSNVQCGLAAAAVILLMLGLSVAKTRWRSIASALAPYFSISGATRGGTPRRVSGD